LKQSWKRFINLPHLAFWSTPKLGRIKEDPIIFDPTASFPLDIFQGIIHNPTDGFFRQT
jgi:hypothetical protein